MITEAQRDLIALRIALETDFYFFVRYAFYKQTGRKWSRNWHHEKICHKLEAVHRGEVKRLIINMPPRYSKTEIVVIMFMAWCLAKDHDCEFINTSYSARLATNNAAKARDIVAAKWFQEIWPDCGLKGDSTARDDWRTQAGGVVYSAGSGGTITGFGAGKMREGFGGAIIIDDPHKADEVNSDVVRKGVIDWFDNTMQSRTNSPDTPIIVVMQRLHPIDLSGWLLAGGNGEDWDLLCLPAIDAQGNALWPDKHPLDKLLEMQASRSRVFTAQYQQAPSDALLTGALWSLETILKARGAVNKSQCKRIVIAIDPSGGGDEVGICVAGNLEGDRFAVLEDATTSAQSPDAWARLVCDLYRAYDADCIVGETNFGGNMIEALIRTVDRNVRYKEVKASRGKHVRAEPIAALYEQGRVTHNGTMQRLEAQMQEMAVTGWVGSGSPDRLDALVWALTELSDMAPNVKLNMDLLGVVGEW